MHGMDSAKAHLGGCSYSTRIVSMAQWRYKHFLLNYKGRGITQLFNSQGKNGWMGDPCDPSRRLLCLCSTTTHPASRRALCLLSRVHCLPVFLTSSFVAITATVSSLGQHSILKYEIARQRKGQSQRSDGAPPQAPAPLHALRKGSISNSADQDSSAQLPIG